MGAEGRVSSFGILRMLASCKVGFRCAAAAGVCVCARARVCVCLVCALCVPCVYTDVLVGCYAKMAYPLYPSSGLTVL